MTRVDRRARWVKPGRARPEGEYVLYWMQIYRRLDRNHALDRALALAGELAKPLVVYEGLRLDYPWASRRLHRFALEGMQDNAAAAARLGLNYWPWVEHAPRQGRGLLRKLAGRAAVVVTDDFPGFIVPGQTAALAARSPAPVVAVDGNGLFPLTALGPPVVSAAQLRRRIHRAFPEAWAGRARARPRLPRTARGRVRPPFEPADLSDLDRLLGALPVDPSVAPVAGLPGGSVAARRRLRRFLRRGLPGYAAHRSAPAPPGAAHASGLSPYLHFGHLSVQAVVEAALRRTGRWTPRQLDPAAVGRREGFFCRDADVNSFLDQVTVWRDLGFHWLWHRRREPRRLAGALPRWAQATLAAHRRDRRPHRYTLARWEAAATHDPLWNAAQRELVATGTLHNYLRMLWGKKVLEWSRTPEAAYRTLVHLNNKYALDGRDPNSYAGILWCFGLFDRPWGPARPVFGTVRYMSSRNTARKFRLGPYLDYVARLPFR